MADRDRRYFSDEDKDKGYAYVVLLTAFLVSFLEMGNHRIARLFFLEFEEYLNASMTDVIILFWLPSVFQALSGLFLGPVIVRYGVRSVTIFGTILASVCLVIPYFAPSYPVLIGCIGVGIGVANGCLFMGSTCAVMQCFDKSLSLAIAFQRVGFSLGGFLYTLIVIALTASYHWRGALLILGGLQLNGVVFGAMFRPVQNKTDDRQQGRRTIGGNVLRFLKDCFDISLLKRRRLLLHFVSLTLVAFGSSGMWRYVSPVYISGYTKWKAAMHHWINKLSSRIVAKTLVFIYRYAKRNYKALIIAVAAIFIALMNVVSYFAHTFPQMLAADIVNWMLSAVYGVFLLSIIPDLSPSGKVPHVVGYTMLLMRAAALVSPIVAYISEKWTGNDVVPFVMYVSVMIFGGFLSLGTFYLQMKRRRRQTEAQSNLARNIEMNN